MLFKEIAKTYQAQWVDKNIVINNINVVIKPPYNQDSCSSDQEKPLQRIKKIVFIIAYFRSKLPTKKSRSS